MYILCVYKYFICIYYVYNIIYILYMYILVVFYTQIRSDFFDHFFRGCRTAAPEDFNVAVDSSHVCRTGSLTMTSLESLEEVPVNSVVMLACSACTSSWRMILCKGISPENMARNMVQYLHFRILKFPLKNVETSCNMIQICGEGTVPWLSNWNYYLWRTEDPDFKLPQVWGKLKRITWHAHHMHSSFGRFVSALFW